MLVQKLRCLTTTLSTHLTSSRYRLGRTPTYQKPQPVRLSIAQGQLRPFYLFFFATPSLLRDYFMAAQCNPFTREVLAWLIINRCIRSICTEFMSTLPTLCEPQLPGAFVLKFCVMSLQNNRQPRFQLFNTNKALTIYFVRSRSIVGSGFKQLWFSGTVAEGSVV
jgi:hypothetical protein